MLIRNRIRLRVKMPILITRRYLRKKETAITQRLRKDLLILRKKIMYVFH